MFCEKCGKELPEGAKFCEGCGAPVGGTQAKEAPKNSFEETVKNLGNTADVTGDFDAADIAKNKVLSLFAYIGILFLIPLLAAPNSKFARFHTNQGACPLCRRRCLGRRQRYHQSDRRRRAGARQPVLHPVGTCFAGAVHPRDPRHHQCLHRQGEGASPRRHVQDSEVRNIDAKKRPRALFCLCGRQRTLRL